jgi:phage terminase large subunit-like protein
VEVKQTPGQLNGAMKEIERLLLQGGIKHDGNPVMHWCFGNVVVRKSMEGNIAPDKKRQRDRIDGVSALLTAARVGIFQERPQTYSYGGM